MSKIGKQKPVITEVKSLAKTRLFNIEQVDLEFSNGEKRVFERLKSSGRKAVVIAAVHNNQLLLVNEYAVGSENYELGLPKGLVDLGETIFEAANRELQEEIGMKANYIKHIMTLSLAPNYMSHVSELVLAYDLTPSSLEGDEPEPLEVVPCDLNNIEDYIISGKIHEVRSIASIYIIKNYLSNTDL